MFPVVAVRHSQPFVEAAHGCAQHNHIKSNQYCYLNSRDVDFFQRASCLAKSSLKSSYNASCGRGSLLGIQASTNGKEAVHVEEAIRRTEPLTKKDLIDFIASGCTPQDQWRIGTEHEKFGFELRTLKPIGYEQIRRLLEGIAGRYNWDKIIEDGFISGLKKGTKSVTLEGGGQVELSGAPLENLHETFAEFNSHFAEVNDIAREMGIGFLGCGFQPKWPLNAIPMMPQEKVRVMRDYFAETGTTGLNIIKQTCTVQVNLDFSSEEDMIKKFRVGLALQPIATALFANSPFTEGKPNGFVSYRSELYTSADNDRTGMLPFVFEDSFGFEKYVDYALDVPMLFMYRNHNLMNCCGMSFKDFILGKLPNMPGEIATLKDWGNHLAQIYAEVRLKRILEMRGSDVGPSSQLCALPALWVGLLYDDKSLQAALELVEDWTPEERHMLRNKVPRLGLKTPFRDSLVHHVAQDVVNLAKEGLQRRAFNEAGFLDQAVETAKTGVTPAEKLLKLYSGDWKGSVDHIFEELRY